MKNGSMLSSSLLLELTPNPGTKTGSKAAENSMVKAATHGKENEWTKGAFHLGRIVCLVEASYRKWKRDQCCDNRHYLVFNLATKIYV